MDLNKITRFNIASVLVLSLCFLAACTVSYKFNGSSINYDKVKTISFENFPNRSAAFVWGPMESMFNTELQDRYMQQTRLKQVRQNGDLQLAGEITNYDAYNKGVGSDGYSTMAELKMTVNVRFVNNTASREYNSTQQLSAVQEELVNQMIDEIVEQIFNATVANW